MTFRIATAVVALVAALLATAACARAAEPFRWDHLAFLTGHWVYETEGRLSEEFWTDARAGMMAGVNRSVRDNRTGFEYLRIIEDEGAIYYVASPGGGPASSFHLIEWEGNRAVFENKAHDFPQRIIYWMDEERLRARIEGLVKGKSQSSEWYWFPARSDAHLTGAKEMHSTD